MKKKTASKKNQVEKVKFSSGAVVHCGDARSATDFIRDHGGRGRSIDWGTSTSGDEGTSTSGDWGTSTSGYGGTSRSGDGGIVVCRGWDGRRERLAVGYVCEDGIEPNTAYRADERGKLVKVTS